jgi:peptidoglycan/LPS O-acetylase OafA/YrhL
VVGFHAGLPALRGAFVAVDVFFVLSGFFLATTVARRLATGEEIGALDLAARRAWRLLPALVIVLLGTLATTLLYAPIDRAAVATQSPSRGPSVTTWCSSSHRAERTRFSHWR